MSSRGGEGGPWEREGESGGLGWGGVGWGGWGGWGGDGGVGGRWTGPVRSGEVSLRGRAEMPRHQNRANFPLYEYGFRGWRLRLRRRGGGRG